MYKLFCLIFLGYLPKWKVIHEGRYEMTHNGQVYRTGIKYVLQEEQTGRIKSRLA